MAALEVDDSDLAALVVVLGAQATLEARVALGTPVPTPINIRRVRIMAGTGQVSKGSREEILVEDNLTATNIPEEAEKRAKEERAKEERAREQRAKEERAREERAREERAREERVREERAKQERAREERAPL